MIAPVKIRFKRKNRIHPVDIPLDLFHAPGIPGPQLRRNVIKYFQTDPFGKPGNTQVETGIIHQDHHVRLPTPDILTTQADIGLDLTEILQYGQKSHDSRIFVMPDDLRSCLTHQVPAPTPDVGFRIFSP